MDITWFTHPTETGDDGCTPLRATVEHDGSTFIIRTGVHLEHDCDPEGGDFLREQPSLDAARTDLLREGFIEGVQLPITEPADTASDAD